MPLLGALRAQRPGAAECAASARAARRRRGRHRGGAAMTARRCAAPRRAGAGVARRPRRPRRRTCCAVAAAGRMPRRARAGRRDRAAPRRAACRSTRAFVDSARPRACALGDVLSAATAVPVVLVLGYYRCPNLCGRVMRRRARGARRKRPAATTRTALVAVSIDPDETPADARSRRAIDLRLADAACRADRRSAGDPLDARRARRRRRRDRARWRGRSASRSRAAPTAATTGAAPPSRTPPASSSSRPTAASRATSSACASIRPTLRAAVDDAARRLDRQRSPTACVLLCAHLDPTLGRFTASVMLGLRASAASPASRCSACWIWRHRRAPPRASAAMNEPTRRRPAPAAFA